MLCPACSFTLSCYWTRSSRHTDNPIGSAGGSPGSNLGRHKCCRRSGIFSAPQAASGRNSVGQHLAEEAIHFCPSLLSLQAGVGFQGVQPAAEGGIVSSLLSNGPYCLLHSSS